MTSTENPSPMGRGRRPTVASFHLAKKPRGITKFDDSDLAPMPQARVRPPAGLVVKNTREPSHILMTALLEHLCQVYAQDDNIANALFQMICERLSQLDFINPLIFKDEMSGIRNQYRNIVHNLLKAGMTRLSKRSPSITYTDGEQLPGIMNLPKEITWNIENLLNMQTSRYKTEFVEIECIGKGGFGAVFRARNKLEGREYAVKKIRFAHSTSEVVMKMLREVKALANLRHVNIVGYNAAWMEHDLPSYTRSAPVPRARVQDVGTASSASSSGGGPGSSSSSSSDNKAAADRGHSVSVSIKFEKSSSSSCSGEEKHREYSSEKSTGPSLHRGEDAAQHRLTGAVTERRSTESELHVFKSSSSSFHRQSSAHSFLHTEQTEELGCSVMDRRLARHDDSHVLRFLYGAEQQMRCAADFKRSVSHDPKTKEEEPPAPVGPRRRRSPHGYIFQTPVTLFIQMELCHRTLQEWMKERNNLAHTQPIHPEEQQSACMRIFEQVLQGVQYIHSQGIIHRDLKPRNIFLMEPDLHIKIGDFGLATEDILRSDGKVTILSPSPHEIRDAFLFDKLTTGVGTTQYAAPEQLEGSLYSSQSDVFSLGVILYELFHCYGTEMERVKSLTTLRLGTVSPEFAERWPAQADAVRRMTRANPQERPTVSELLQGTLFVSKENVINQLEAAVRERDAEAARLRREVSWLQQQLQERDGAVRELNSQVLQLTSELAALKLAALSSS